MSVALHGNLRDFGIAEVFQLIGQQRKTGLLEIDGESGRLRVAFRDGGVAEAAPVGPYPDWAIGDMLVRVGLLTPEGLVELERRLPDPGEDGGEDDLPRLLVDGAISRATIEEIRELVTVETIFTLLRWTRGSFHFTARPVRTRTGAAHRPAEQILMDGLRMVDEWRTLPEAVRRESTVLARGEDFEAYRAALPDEPPERLLVAERLFLLIDGRSTVRRVVDVSRLGTFEAASVLARMLRAGVVRPVDPEALPAGRRRAPARGPRRPPAVLAAAVAPFVGLVLVVLAIVLAPEAGPPASLDADPGRRAEWSARTRLLRNAIEAHRFATGSWPEAPADAAGAGLALAADEAAPYYYARRGGSFVLLPPPH